MTESRCYESERSEAEELPLLDPKTDYIFKQLFGVDGSEEVLRNFLNSLLKNDPYIEKIELKNTEISKVLQNDKTCKLDVRGILNDNLALDIEIQCANTGEIIERGISYLDELNIQSLQAGERYDTIKTLGIWILSENITKRINAISEACMVFLPNSPDGYEIATRNKRLFFIELPKFNEEEANKKDLLSSWLAFLKNPETYDSSWIHNEAIERAEEKLKFISLDPEMREIARLRERDRRERIDEIQIAAEKGMAQGIEKGMAQGIEKGERKKALETAKNFLRMGLTPDQVAKGTGLSIQDIMAL